MQVLWKEQWYPARILRVEGYFHYITYEGFGSEWDEWVISDRIKAR